MAISVVNGYVCTSSCDVAKAKKGEDPHPATHAANGESRDDATSRGPAVLFGGSLGNRPATDTVKAVEATGSPDPADWRTRKLTVDILA